MVDTLIHTETAWQLYLSKLAYNGLEPVLWETVEADCGAGSGSWDNYARFAGASNIEVAAALIGIDEEACVSYWHLTGGHAIFIRDTSGMGCFLEWHPEQPAGFLSVPKSSAGGLHGFEVEVWDGGSESSPHSGVELLPHDGFPVCAAVRVGDDEWMAFAGGDAAELSVAAAREACGTAGMDVCGGGGEPDIDLLIRFHWLPET